ncbi:MAG: sigma-70 family RNA polymerase sigma factor [Rhizobacter sp.]|nr:sigma-70 family RNA polymerase sigma factor [Chlorobiales bacterium]
MQQIFDADEIAAAREQVFIGLYTAALPLVAKYVSQMGGSFEEAKDIFQDAVVIYYEKVMTASVAITHSEQAYLLGIAKHLWVKRYRERRSHLPIETVADNLVAETVVDGRAAETANLAAGEDRLSTDEDRLSHSSGKLMQFLETAGERCMQILRAFYYDKRQMADVATMFGYSSVRSATVQKYKCLEKVRETIKAHSLHYADFVE